MPAFRLTFANYYHEEGIYIPTHISVVDLKTVPTYISLIIMLSSYFSPGETTGYPVDDL